MVYVLMKLKLLRGKWLIFVNTIETGYRLKLFLEKFSIRSCLLNSELPQSSRYHIVEEFNKGVYDYIIASDANLVDDKADGEEGKKRKRGQDEEYGVARGVDFKEVSVVVNFDIPKSSRTYQHRIGRTARGSANGRALNLVSDMPKFERIMNKQKG